VTAYGKYICNIVLVLVLFLLLPSLLRNVVYVKKQLFLHNLLQNNASWNVLYVERGLLHLNINIIYSKVLQALSVILIYHDMSKQVGLITIWNKQWHD